MAHYTNSSAAAGICQECLSDYGRDSRKTQDVIDEKKVLVELTTSLQLEKVGMFTASKALESHDPHLAFPLKISSYT